MVTTNNVAVITTDLATLVAIGNRLRDITGSDNHPAVRTAAKLVRRMTELTKVKASAEKKAQPKVEKTQPKAAAPKEKAKAETASKKPGGGLEHYRNVKAACKEAGLSTKGKLSELEDRLAANHKAEQPKAEKAPKAAAKTVDVGYAEVKPVGIEDRKQSLLNKLAKLAAKQDEATLESVISLLGGR